MRKAWERQSTDSEAAWSAFVAYRDQRTPRRVPWGAGRQRGGNPVEIARWYREGRWALRVAEYDRHLDDIRRSHTEAILAESSRDVAAHTMALTSRAREVVEIGLEKLLDKLEKVEVYEMKPNEITRLLQVTATLDRLLRGESTAKVDIPVRDLSHLTDAELDEIERALLPPDEDEGA